MALGDITNVTTNEVRLSFVHLMKPYAYNEGDDPKYSCTILVPKTDQATLGRIQQAIEAAKQRGANDKWGGVIPPRVDVTFYDGDGVKPSDGMPFGAECRGHYVLSAKSGADRPPEIVDKFGNPIINSSEIYSGMYARVNIEFFPYENRGKKGVSCALGPVMKMRDGEPLGGSAPTAAQVFGFAQQTAPAQPQYSAPQAAPAQPQQGYYQPQYAAPQAVPVQPQQGYYQPAATQAPMPGAVDPITGQPIDNVPF